MRVIGGKGCRLERLEEIKGLKGFGSDVSRGRFLAWLQGFLPDGKLEKGTQHTTGSVPSLYGPAFQGRHT